MTDIYTTQPAAAPPPPPGNSDNRLNLLIGSALVFLVIALGVLGWVVIQGGGDGGSQVATADTNETRKDRRGKDTDKPSKDQDRSGDADSSVNEDGDDQVTLPDSDSTAPTTADGGGSGAVSSTASGTGGAGVTPLGTSPITPTAVNPSNTRDSVNLTCTDQPLSYGANQLIDGDPQTGWGASKHDGSGEFVQFELGGTKQLSTVGITPGYLRVAERSAAGCSIVSAFPYNRFINSVRWEFSDGSSVEQGFENIDEMQSVDVDKQTSFVRMVILSTTRPAGADDDTVISEAQFTGTP